LLAGATLWYLRDSPLFLGPYFVLSCLGFIAILRRGGIGRQRSIVSQRAVN